MSELIKLKSVAMQAADMVEEGRVKKQLYSDPEIFEEEMDKVFNNTWVYVGHESEVPEAGSFKVVNTPFKFSAC